MIKTTNIRLAFGSKARVGKDTAAAYVLKKFGGKSFRFAKPVYEIASLIQNYMHKPTEKDPGLLQIIGSELRKHYGDNVWVDRLIDDLSDDASSNAVVPDMRYPNELDALTANGFVSVKITRDSRVIDRDPFHSSEIGLDNANFQYHIRNDFNPHHLFACLNNIILENFLPDCIGKKYAFTYSGRYVSANGETKIEFVHTHFGDSYEEITSNVATSLHNILFNADPLDAYDDDIRKISHLEDKIIENTEDYVPKNTSMHGDDLPTYLMSIDTLGRLIDVWSSSAAGSGGTAGDGSSSTPSDKKIYNMKFMFPVYNNVEGNPNLFLELDTPKAIVIKV